MPFSKYPPVYGCVAETNRVILNPDYHHPGFPSGCEITVTGKRNVGLGLDGPPPVLGFRPPLHLDWAEDRDIIP